MNGEERKAEAQKLLYDFGLLHKLDEYGKAHLIGSYRMDLMVWNDLDIDVENEQMSLERLYDLTDFIIKTFHPVWYEAKYEVVDGKPCYFHGFETTILGSLWNVDVWFLDKNEIESATKYCDDIYARTKHDEDLRTAIIAIKSELIARGLYRSEYHASVDVYDAVLNRNIRTMDELLKRITPLAHRDASRRLAISQD